MGKQLIIDDADFQGKSINVIVSTIQTLMDANHYYNDNSVEVSVVGITGISKIEIPSGVTKLYLKNSQSDLEPEALNCFDENNTPIGLAGGSHVGVIDFGTYLFYELPTGTKYISYIGVNTYVAASYDLGLNLIWIGY